MVHDHTPGLAPAGSVLTAKIVELPLHAAERAIEVVQFPPDRAANLCLLPESSHRLAGDHQLPLEALHRLVSSRALILEGLPQPVDVRPGRFEGPLRRPKGFDPFRHFRGPRLCRGDLLAELPHPVDQCVLLVQGDRSSLLLELELHHLLLQLVDGRTGRLRHRPPQFANNSEPIVPSTAGPVQLTSERAQFPTELPMSFV